MQTRNLLVTFSATRHALHPVGHPGSQPESELLFRPPLWSPLSGMAPESLRVFVESPQQAAAGAISASFTGGTAQAFHLGQGYGFAPSEQRETMHHGLDQTLQAKAAVVSACVEGWGA